MRDCWIRHGISEVSKRFFFEKKKQKTFVTWVWRLREW
jgi:hypothetical protein